ncbi:hypothetical protein ERJ75_000665500 [Trypanosoma vivax]|nr:hypothetical protein ERJ75_000665500 [Trypanosoma vivax]
MEALGGLSALVAMTLHASLGAQRVADATAVHSDNNVPEFILLCTIAKHATKIAEKAWKLETSDLTTEWLVAK